MFEEIDFERLKRLPNYVFAVVNDLKMDARRAGEDVIDFSMGNPDGPTPKHIVEKLVETARKPKSHRYSASAGIYKLRLAICNWYKRNIMSIWIQILKRLQQSEVKKVMSIWYKLL